MTWRNWECLVPQAVNVSRVWTILEKHAAVLSKDLMVFIQAKISLQIMTSSIYSVIKGFLRSS